MNALSVRKLPADAARTTPWGPARVEDRHANSDLTTIGASVVVFDEDGMTERWIYTHEELLYVIEGEITLFLFDGGEKKIDGRSGDLFQITTGSDLQYLGTKGTRLLLAFPSTA